MGVAEEQSRLFGQLIREHRMRSGLSQRDVAFAVGVGERFIVDLEAGKPTAQIGRALAVARALGIDLLPRPPESSSAAGSAAGKEPEGEGYDLPEVPTPWR